MTARAMTTDEKLEEAVIHLRAAREIHLQQSTLFRLILKHLQTYSVLTDSAILARIGERDSNATASDIGSLLIQFGEPL